MAVSYLDYDLIVSMLSAALVPDYVASVNLAGTVEHAFNGSTPNNELPRAWVIPGKRTHAGPLGRGLDREVTERFLVVYSELDDPPDNGANAYRKLQAISYAGHAALNQQSIVGRWKYPLIDGDQGIASTDKTDARICHWVDPWLITAPAN